jgi:hypothetical protein
MPTSSTGALALESAFAATAVLAVSALSWPDSFGLGTGALHPAWIAVIALAARYGVPGLFVALPLVWLPLGGVTFLTSGGEWPLWERIVARTDVVPLCVSVLVAWVTISHQNRLARTTELLAEAEAEAEYTRRWGAALEDSLTYLRDRSDRIEMSISFWRRISECLERGDLRQASSAALELSMVRTGAEAGCVAIREGASELIARSTRWSTGAPDGDATVRAAVSTGHIRQAIDLTDATRDDCDVAIPIVDPGDGAVLGVIALRGVEPTRTKAAELSDLSLISGWLAPALACQIHGPRLRSVGEESGR